MFRSGEQELVLPVIHGLRSCRDGQNQLFWVWCVKHATTSARGATGVSPSWGTHAAHLPRGLSLIRQPANSLDGIENQWLAGLRLVAIDSPDDEEWWEQQLSAGLPCFALGAQLHVQCSKAEIGSLLMALAFGNFSLGDLPQGFALDEQRDGISWQAEQELEVSYLVRDGFEAAREYGCRGQWRDADQAQAGYVRMEVRHSGGRLLSQPRWLSQ